MILRNFNGSGKTKTSSTAETITFTSSDIPGTGVVAYHLDLNGTNNDWDSLTRVRVKAGGATIWDVNELQHAALVQRFSKKAGPGATAARATIPLHWARDNSDPANVGKYDCGFPAGLAPAVELVTDATGAGSAAGGWTIAWTLSTLPFKWYPMYIGSAGNIAASVTNGRIPITQKGFLRAVCLPDSGDINRVRVIAGGIELCNLNNKGLLEVGEYEQGGTVTTDLVLAFEDLFPLTPGNSWIELDTAAGFGGAAEEFALYTLVPQGQ